MYNINNHVEEASKLGEDFTVDTLKEIREVMRFKGSPESPTIDYNRLKVLEASWRNLKESSTCFIDATELQCKLTIIDNVLMLLKKDIEELINVTNTTT